MQIMSVTTITLFKMRTFHSCNMGVFHLRYHVFTLTRKASSNHNIPRQTVDADEIEKFRKIAPDWWKFEDNLLMKMNALRVPFIRNGILSTAASVTNKSKPLEGFNIIDIGCGGGFLCEPLARLGASVTGLDPGAELIKAASAHASQDPEIKDKITYICGTVEDFVTTNNKYDAVTCSEVVEHVNDVDFFLKNCCGLIKDDGHIFMTTISKTVMSYFIAILCYEYIFRFIPIGTHQWNKFITAKDLEKKLLSNGCRTAIVNGMVYNPVCSKFSWSSFYGAFYALHAVKDCVV